MLTKKYLSDIKWRKGALKQSIERQRNTIEQYDKEQHSSSDATLGDGEFDKYLEFTKELERMKRQLQILMLEPDGFMLTKETSRILLEITTRGEMMFFKVIPTADPIIPPEMANFAYSRLEMTEDGGFEVRYVETMRYIDELRMVVPTVVGSENLPAIILNKITDLLPAPKDPTTPVAPDGIKFEWKSGPEIYGTEDPHDLVEVIGCHLNKFKKAKVIEVNKLRDLFSLKSTSYNSDSIEHEELLMKLWCTLYPDQELLSRKSTQWKSVGFQGTDPATDFRGMGLLGLHNLLYFAQHQTDRVREILELHREYPFAVAGINITNMLLEILNMDNSINNSNAPIWENELLLFFCRAADDNNEIQGFEEVYCMAMDVLDSLWVNMEAKYMDFPRVLQMVKLHIRQVATTRATDWEDFRNRIQRILITNGPPA